MGARLRALALTAILLGVGVFLGSALAQWTGPVAPGLLPPSRIDQRVRVEVRNGAGREGWARTATDVLRDRGFDVVFFGNAASFGLDSSVVLDRVGRTTWARGVADALGIELIRSEPDSTLYLDVTVVLGEDWTPPARPAGGPAPVVPWWSPRRWLGPGEDRGGVLADPRPEG